MVFKSLETQAESWNAFWNCFKPLNLCSSPFDMWAHVTYGVISCHFVMHLVGLPFLKSYMKSNLVWVWNLHTLFRGARNVSRQPSTFMSSFPEFSESDGRNLPEAIVAEFTCISPVVQSLKPHYCAQLQPFPFAAEFLILYQNFVLLGGVGQARHHSGAESWFAGTHFGAPELRADR